MVESQYEELVLCCGVVESTGAASTSDAGAIVRVSRRRARNVATEVNATIMIMLVYDVGCTRERIGLFAKMLATCAERYSMQNESVVEQRKAQPLFV